MTLARRAELAVVSAREADLDDIEEMINDFVKGHPAETHSRSRSKLREAYFGASPVATLLVATRGARLPIPCRPCEARTPGHHSPPPGSRAEQGGRTPKGIGAAAVPRSHLDVRLRSKLEGNVR